MLQDIKIQVENVESFDILNLSQYFYKYVSAVSYLF
jgi:hypothetical protein